MVQKLSLFEKELYQRVDEIMHYVWDPIGIAGTPAARDEYDSYLPQVFRLLVKELDQDISGYLVDVESKSMGLKPNPKKASQTAEMLLDWREALRQKHGESHH